MFIIFPYKIKCPKHVFPWMVYVIIGVTIVIFLSLNLFRYETTKPFALWEMSLKGLLGHMWLHAEWFHICCNMTVLWVFGRAICSKLGNIYFLIIYLLGGVMSGVVHLLINGDPIIGASGAISMILGCYFVLYPYNRVKCLLLLLVIPLRRFQVAGIWILLYWFAMDLLGSIMGLGKTAYWAHVSGFIFGILLGAILLLTKLVERDSTEDAVVDLVTSK